MSNVVDLTEVRLQPVASVVETLQAGHREVQGRDPAIPQRVHARITTSVAARSDGDAADLATFGPGEDLLQRRLLDEGS